MSDSPDTTIDTTLDTTPEAAGAAGPEPTEGQVVGPYRVERKLGRGGMGVVFRAIDTRLERAVALKFLSPALAGDAQALARFLREARAAGAIDHPNVIAIYEVGEHDGLPFIAMALNEGESLKQRLARDPPLAPVEAARLLAQIAGALACAHAQDIVHRDVKPGNVMLTPDGQVKLVDFGLAKILSDVTGELTRDGEVLGTLNYMAPEQHRGGEIGAETDLWAVGAVGFEMLAGAPPFRRPSTASLVTAVLGEEPPSLRGRAPADLETILLKCLEKDPLRRYSSAEALAADLRRFIAGEPISVKRAGPLARLARRAGRNRPAAAITAVGLIGMLALGGGLYESRRSAAERARRAGALGQRVQQMRSAMRSAHLLPLHDTALERERVRASMREVENEMPALGREGRGPGEFALGVGAFALGDQKAARAHLETAWAAGERAPELAYALGQVLGADFTKQMNDAPPVDAAARDAREHQLQVELRDPALAYLRAANGAADTSPLYIEALIAFYERHYDVALERARAAFREAPLLYEAALLEARTYVVVGRQKWRAGDFAGGHAAFAEADAAFRRVIDIGRSDDEVYRTWAATVLEESFLFEQRGEDTEKLREQVVEICEQGRRANSQAAWPDGMLGQTHTLMADIDVKRKRDPRAHLREAIAAGERATAAHPNDGEAWAALGFAWGVMADWWDDPHGIDVRPSLQKSLDAYRKSLALRDSADNWHNLATEYSALMRWQIDHGADFEQATEDALHAYEASLKIDPAEEYAHYNACSTLADAARAGLDRGRAAGATLERAAKHCAATRPTDKTLPGPLGGGGALDWVRALDAAAAGKDPLPFLAKSIQIDEEAIAQAPEQADQRVNVTRPLVTRAEFFLAKSAVAEARPSIERALAEARKAVALDSEAASSHEALGEALLADGRARAAAGRDPGATLDEAAREIDRALAIKGDDRRTLETAAEIELAIARCRFAHNSSSAARAAVLAGCTFVALALAVDPDSARAFAIRAALFRAAGHSLRAEEDFAAALKRNPFLKNDPLAASLR